MYALKIINSFYNQQFTSVKLFTLVENIKYLGCKLFNTLNI